MGAHNPVWCGEAEAGDVRSERAWALASVSWPWLRRALVGIAGLHTLGALAFAASAGGAGEPWSLQGALDVGVRLPGPVRAVGLLLTWSWAVQALLWVVVTEQAGRAARSPAGEPVLRLHRGLEWTLLLVSLAAIFLGPGALALLAGSTVARLGWLGLAVLWFTLWTSASYSVWRPFSRRGPAAWLSLRFGLVGPVLAGGLAASVGLLGLPAELTAWVGAACAVLWLERGLRER